MTCNDSGSTRSNDPDDAAVMALFDEHVALADRLARRYSHGIAIDEDLQQVAHLALFLACRRFDPDLGRFLRYASMTIVGELKKHLRSHGWTVHVPRGLQEDSITLARATERMTHELGRRPLISELAHSTGMSVERIAEAVRVNAARFRAPVERAADSIEADGDLVTSALLNTALQSLDRDQRRIIRLRYEEGLTQREIGERLGVSQPEAYRRISSALDSLRRQLELPHDDRTSR